MPERPFVLVPQPAHDPAPRVGVDRAEDGFGHSVPEVVRPPGQGPVDALDEPPGSWCRVDRYVLADTLSLMAWMAFLDGTV